jgi:hypothetical protein
MSRDPVRPQDEFMPFTELSFGQSKGQLHFPIPVFLPLRTINSPTNKYRRGLSYQLLPLVSPARSDTLAGTRLPLMFGTAKRSV